MGNQSDTYDKRSVYRKKILPLIKQIKLICNTEKMPMFISVAVKNDEDETEYENEVVYASTGVSLGEKRIGYLLLMINGFETDLPDYIKECIVQLNDYLTKVTVKEEDKTDTALTKDKIGDMYSIGQGGCTIRPTKEMLKGGTQERESGVEEKENGRFRSFIFYHGKTYELGEYNTEEDALKALDKAEESLPMAMRKHPDGEVKYLGDGKFI